jgi:transcriptional regulator with XRE-family HTH domain
MPLKRVNDKMKDRIRQIMESRKMTQSEFSEYIELAPATLSSIFNGRTRPTLNVVEALKKKIPNINIEWLMFGTGSMYLPDEIPSDLPLQEGQNTQQSMLDFDQPVPQVPQISPSTPQNFNSVRNTHQEIAREEIKIVDKPQRRVIEIRVFYDDQTWETFVPAKK